MSNRAPHRPALPVPTSVSAALRSAQGLYQQERYGLAEQCFRAIAADWTTPDIWIQAMYGVAECERLSDRLAAASHSYRRVIERSEALQLPHGRFSEATRVTLLHAWMALTDIGRFTLRVPQEILRTLPPSGKQLLCPESGPSAMRCALEFSELMVERCGRQMASAAFEMSRLARQLKLIEQIPPVLDPVLVLHSRAATELEAGFPCVLPPPAEPAQPAFCWHRSHRLLLATRLAISRRDFSEAQRHMQTLDEEAEGLKRYPDLALQAQLLQLLCAEQPQLFDTALLELRQTLLPRTHVALSELADLATPLWLLTWLLEQFLRDGAALAVSTPLTRFQSEAATLAAALHGHPWLIETLASRGLVPAALARTADLLLERAEPATGELPAMLAELRMAVCP